MLYKHLKHMLNELSDEELEQQVTLFDPYFERSTRIAAIGQIDQVRYPKRKNQKSPIVLVASSWERG